jgi:hypothetical protein
MIHTGIVLEEFLIDLWLYEPFSIVHNTEPFAVFFLKVVLAFPYDIQDLRPGIFIFFRLFM